MKTISNDRCAAIVLRCLYSKPIGTHIPNIAALKALCAPKLNGIDEPQPMNFVAALGGLRRQGLIQCNPVEGDGTTLDIFDVELTSEGRTWAEEHSPAFRLRRFGWWLGKHIIAELITVIVTIVVGLLLRG
jgi:hypothetical protein